MKAYVEVNIEEGMKPGECHICNYYKNDVCLLNECLTFGAYNLPKFCPIKLNISKNK